MNVSNLNRDDWLRATFPEWGTWLNEEIEEENVSANNFSMWWLGCMGVWLKSAEGTNLSVDFWCGSGKRTKKNKYMAPNHQYRRMCGCSLNQPNRRVIPVVIDPFAVRNLDAFLCTHYHSDHIDPYVTTAVLQNCPQVKFIGPKGCVDIWKSWGVPEDKLIQVASGDEFQIKDIKIIALKSFDRTIEFSAYPVEGVEASMDDKAVNYVIETSGGTLYHAADSSQGLIPGVPKYLKNFLQTRKSAGLLFVPWTFTTNASFEAINDSIRLLPEPYGKRYIEFIIQIRKEKCKYFCAFSSRG